MLRRISKVLLLLSLLSSSLSCSADDVETPVYDIGLFPKTAFSGFNATKKFNVIYTTGGKNPEWSVDDTSIATIAPTTTRPTTAGTDVRDLQFALVTTLKPGETTVRLRSQGKTLTARLIVKAYTDEQLAAGKARYETPSAEPQRPPCASCHAKPDGVDHSPLKLAGFDDPVILGVIQEATYPANPTGGSVTSAFAPTGPLTKFPDHKWNLTDPEKDGILAHLRSLPLPGIQ